MDTAFKTAALAAEHVQAAVQSLAETLKLDGYPQTVCLA